MADNVTLDSMSGGDLVAAVDIGGVKFQRVKVTLGAGGENDGDVSDANPMPVSGSLVITNADITAVKNSLAAANSFAPSVYDDVNLSYTGDTLTGVVFKLGAVTISTLTLIYVGGKLDSVVKT